MQQAVHTPKSNGFRASADVTMKTDADALYRIDLLEIEIEHIDNQIAVARDRDRQGIRQLDTNWVRKATDSVRYKQEEIASLKLWMNTSVERRKDVIIDIVKREFDEVDWKDIEAEADEVLSKRS